jgi:hypothetical protein
MLTAGGRAAPFGDLAKCATAAGDTVEVNVNLRRALRRSNNRKGLSKLAARSTSFFGRLRSVRFQTERLKKLTFD